MRIISLSLSLFIITLTEAQQPLPAIGQWREHLPYNSAIDLCAGDGFVFCATPYSLFSIDVGNNSIQRRSRMTGLSETGVSCVQYDPDNHKLIVAYKNSNVDILYRDQTHNIPDIKRDNISGDKTIYNIYVSGNNYYLCCGLGVILLDGNKYEIKDSWFIGAGGGQVRVNGFAMDLSFYYAATNEGLKKASRSAPNPGDPANWQNLSGTGGLSTGICQNVFIIQDRLIAQQNDSLFSFNGSNWSLLYASGWPFVRSQASENKLLVCERQNSGASRVTILNPDASIYRRLEVGNIISFPRNAILVNNEPWVADQYGCLSKFTSSSFVQFSPNSPQGIASGELLVYDNKFYAAAGSVNESWNYQFNGDGIFNYQEGGWTNINRYKYSVLDSLLDFISLTVDKRDGSLWAGSFGGGLLHIKSPGSFEIFKQNGLGPTIGDPASYRVSGLTFDRNNNLWIANFGSARPLVVRKADGSWRNFSLPFALFENAVAQIVTDDNHYLWIQAPLGNGLIVFDAGQSIDNISDDQWKRLSTGPGNGNLPGNDVFCVTKDKSGFIWVGTSNGIGVLQCPAEIFSSGGCDAVWPVVPNGNFAGYLFNGQEVRSIAVDGADRKWIATKNGVFLVSATGESVVYQFTEDNSPLLSSDVRKVTIDDKTGEVFFATLKGICSFRSTATGGGEKNEDVLVFPNPVPPGYSGLIAIRGLAENSIVKITELNGRLVFQTRALGGQATWDGKNYRGQRISTGAYLVLAATEDRKEHVATKIFFISK